MRDLAAWTGHITEVCIPHTFTDASGTDQLSAWCLNWLVNSAETENTLEISERQICGRGRKRERQRGCDARQHFGAFLIIALAFPLLLSLVDLPRFFGILFGLPPFRNGDKALQILQCSST